jgi:hypothetical protein
LQSLELFRFFTWKLLHRIPVFDFAFGDQGEK